MIERSACQSWFVPRVEDRVDLPEWWCDDRASRSGETNVYDTNRKRSSIRCDAIQLGIFSIRRTQLIVVEARGSFFDKIYFYSVQIESPLPRT
jgi:hypothetical protein